MEPLPRSDVPVFNCIVYLRRSAEGVSGRVANLPDLERAAESERRVMSELVAAFKQQVAEALRRGERIAWIEPPPPGDDEQTRWIPVHL